MSYKFYGGVHPPISKTLTADKAIKKPFIPKKAIIPLLQHRGLPAEPLVKVGDTVKTGALIGASTGPCSSVVHSSLRGKVTKIAHCATPLSPRALSVTIEAEGENQDFNLSAPKDVESLSGEELLAVIRDSGIVGLGGGAFPTHIKLAEAKNTKIDFIILNGAECEPYLTCDQRLMMENSSEILKGLGAMAKISGAKAAYIAIEDNKPAAIRAMEKALSSQAAGKNAQVAKIVTLKTKYPQGAEKQVIKAALNRVVPAGGLPMDVGCVVQNVATAFAVYEALYLGKPLIERVVTITGPCVRNPLNARIRIGTLLSDLTDLFGGFIKEPKKIIVGGPMMGFAQYTMDVPITKEVNGVIFLSEDEIDRSTEGVCIRCGKCIEVCPMGLAPTTLMYNVKKAAFKEIQALGVAHCYECGACAYECPSKIPLLDYIKLGKARVKTIDKCR